MLSSCCELSSLHYILPMPYLSVLDVRLNERRIVKVLRSFARKLRDNAISGPIPDAIGTLGMLEVLEIPNSRDSLGPSQARFGHQRNVTSSWYFHSAYWCIICSSDGMQAERIKWLALPFFFEIFQFV
jgi:hypothetical protein